MFEHRINSPGSNMLPPWDAIVQNQFGLAPSGFTETAWTDGLLYTLKTQPPHVLLQGLGLDSQQPALAQILTGWHDDLTAQIIFKHGERMVGAHAALDKNVHSQLLREEFALLNKLYTLMPNDVVQPLGIFYPEITQRDGLTAGIAHLVTQLPIESRYIRVSGSVVTKRVMDKGGVKLDHTYQKDVLHYGIGEVHSPLPERTVSDIAADMVALQTKVLLLSGYKVILQPFITKNDFIISSVEHSGRVMLARARANLLNRAASTSGNILNLFAKNFLFNLVDTYTLDDIAKDAKLTPTRRRNFKQAYDGIREIKQNLTPRQLFVLRQVLQVEQDVCNKNNIVALLGDDIFQGIAKAFIDIHGMDGKSNLKSFWREGEHTPLEALKQLLGILRHDLIQRILVGTYDFPQHDFIWTHVTEQLIENAEKL